MWGRRLLRSWLCRPLFRAKDIRQRAAAVEELVELLAEEAQKAREILKGNKLTSTTKSYV